MNAPGPVARLALVGAMLALVLVACGGAGQTTTLTAAASGRTVELRIGDELVLQLDGSPGTGFDWELATTGAPVLSLRERSVGSTSTLPGGPATVTYRFRAAADGQAKLVAVYRRSWESLPPERTAELTIVARRP